MQDCLSIEDIAVGIDCDTDDDEGDYNKVRRQLVTHARGLQNQDQVNLENMNKSDDDERQEREVASLLNHEVKISQSNKKQEASTDLLLPSLLELPPTPISSNEKSNNEDNDYYDDNDDDDDDCKERAIEKMIFYLQDTFRFVERKQQGIYVVIRKEDVNVFCLKVVHRTMHERKRLPIEIRILSFLSRVKEEDKRQYLQQMMGYVLFHDVYAFVSPYIPDLLQTKNLSTRHDIVKDIMKQLLIALNNLHRHGIMHRDIKHSNLLWDGTNLTLIDFDKATWNNKECNHHIMIGTFGFMAPEVLRYERDGQEASRPYTEKSDMYSAGVLFGCLLFGITELECKEFHASIFRNDTASLLPTQTARLLLNLLKFKAQNRPSAQMALQSPYFL